MEKCDICEREFNFLLDIECDLLSNRPLKSCNRCNNAISNFYKLMKYLEYIEDKELMLKFKNMLISLIPGTVNKSGERTVGILEAPAGRKKHHAYSGGLLSHIIQMIEISFTIYHYKTYPFHNVLNKGDIVIGCIIHDLYKARECFIKDNRRGYPPFRYAKENTRIPNDIQSMHICSKFGIHLTEYYLNAILVAEGPFSPLWNKLETSKLAALINMADVYSSQILKK